MNKFLSVDELDELDVFISKSVAKWEREFPPQYPARVELEATEIRLLVAQARRAVNDAVAKVRWVEGFYDGSHGWSCGFATVWDNGTWHTWDADGCGGQNSMAPNVAQAKEDATGAAIAQGFVKLSQLMPPELA